MAKFLNTSATNYFLEELIKQAKERVILISPFLKLNDRVKELLEDKPLKKLTSALCMAKANCKRRNPVVEITRLHPHQFL